MKEFFKQIFQDNAGGFSMQRFGTVICLILVIIITIVILKMAPGIEPIKMGEATVVPADTKVLDALIYLDLAVLALGLGIKAIQRFGEKETNIQEVKQ